MIITEQENPSPGGVVANTVHLTDGSGEQTTESTGQRSRGEEESVPLLNLITLVPPIGGNRLEVRNRMGRSMDQHSNEVGAPREDGSLEDAQEEASGEEAAQVADKSLADSDKTETEHHDRH